MPDEVICEAIEVCGDTCRPAKVHLCEDHPVSIYLNGTLAGAFDTFPRDLEALSYGYLLCEGLIASASDVKSSIIKSNRIAVEAGPVARQPPSHAHLPGVDVRLVFERYMSLDQYSPLGRSTGATHCAVLFTAYGGAVSSAEDLHGFGAVSKAIGKAMLSGYDPGHCFLLFTGRATPWTIRAAANAGLPLVICCGSPASGAVAEAQKSGIGLVHIPRPGWMAVYHGEHMLAGLPETSTAQAVWPMSPGTI